MLHLSTSVFTENTAPFGGTDLFLTNPHPNSTIDDCTFSDVGVSDAIIINNPVIWTCQLGHYMPRVGTFESGFTGCLFRCPTGYYGDSPFLSKPVGLGGCKPCALGHFCPTEATTQPSPCPAGTHMPALGAASNTSCIPCVPGTYGPLTGNANATCTACPKGTYSELSGQTECTSYRATRC